MLRISVCKRKLTWKNYMLHRKKKYPMVSPENRHISNKMHTELVVFLKTIIYIYVATTHEKEKS